MYLFYLKRAELIAYYFFPEDSYDLGVTMFVVYFLLGFRIKPMVNVCKLKYSLSWLFESNLVKIEHQ